MFNIKIDEEQALEMLIDRVKRWVEDEEVINLYAKMYENYIYSGCFEGIEFDVDVIVDNDCINYCNIYTQGDEEFDELLKIYKEQGLGDCSCDCNFASFVEAVNDEENPSIILVRC